MFKDVLRDLRREWRVLVVTDLAFRAAAFVLLTPAVSGLFHLFLMVSGRKVLADTDIARFFMHPIGWATLVIVGGATICIFVMELAALLSIIRSRNGGRSIGTIAALRFVGRHAVDILRLTIRFSGRALIITAPFLAVGGGLYIWLLTEYDINYYLSYQPPAFWWAMVSIGGVFIAMAASLMRLTADYGVALPLLLFAQYNVRDGLAESRRCVLGGRAEMARSVIVWFAASSVLSLLGGGLAAGTAQLLMPVARHNLTGVLLVVGLALLLGWVANLCVSLFASITLAGIVEAWYVQHARANQRVRNDIYAATVPSDVRLTRFRLLSGVIVAVLLSAIVGVLALHNAILKDRDVQITAHRGGAASAPENTRAAIIQGIADDADWIEIDVQETKDGVVIVAHDGDLMKVAGQPDKVWELTADELRHVDIGSFFDPKYKDERMPTLAEVLDICHGKVKVNIELKYYGHNDRLEQRVIEVVEAQGMTDEVVLMSLDPIIVKTAKQLRPDWTVGLLTAVAAGDLTKADADFYAVSMKLATPQFIRAAHAKNRRVFVWTVNDRLSMSTMIGRGVDNLITDNPRLVREVIAERANLSPVERFLIDQAWWFDAGASTPDR